MHDLGKNPAGREEAGLPCSEKKAAGKGEDKGDENSVNRAGKTQWGEMSQSRNILIVNRQENRQGEQVSLSPGGQEGKLQPIAFVALPWILLNALLQGGMNVNFLLT